MTKLQLVVLGALGAFHASSAAADPVCPDASYCTVSFASPKDRVTVIPGGRSETFADNGITIRVYLRTCSDVPIVGLPAQEIVLFNSALCICPGGNIADAASDVNGSTTFTGTLSAGGCVENLSIFADGSAVGTLPVRTNSPDRLPASPCYVDGSDLSGLASILGRPELYNICSDWNESGPPTINGSDLSYFAFALGSHCP